MVSEPLLTMIAPAVMGGVTPAVDGAQRVPHAAMRITIRVRFIGERGRAIRAIIVWRVAAFKPLRRWAMGVFHEGRQPRGRAQRGGSRRAPAVCGTLLRLHSASLRSAQDAPLPPQVK